MWPRSSFIIPIQMLLALDVHYRMDTAKVVCIAFNDWQDSMPAQVLVTYVDKVAEYEPGAFYKRELPCLLAALASLDMGTVTAIVVDGYVVLDDYGKPGLGAYLYEALGKNIPVIGVAKTRFFSNTQYVAEVLRGDSKNPLFITNAGISREVAAEQVRLMAGPYRIPALLKLLDMETKTA